MLSQVRFAADHILRIKLCQEIVFGLLDEVSAVVEVVFDAEEITSLQ